MVLLRRRKPVRVFRHAIKAFIVMYLLLKSPLLRPQM